MPHALADTPYEEVFSHRATFLGVTPIAGWSTLPFSSSETLQAVARKGGGAILRTTGALWSTDATGRAWKQLATTFHGSDAILLTGSNAVVHTGSVYLLDIFDDGKCNETKVATVDSACSHSITGGWVDSTSGAVGVGCALGLYMGKVDATSPPPLKPEPTFTQFDDGPVVVTASWGGYVAAATAQRMHWRRPDGAWWWEWVSAGVKATCSHSDASYAGGAVEGVPRAIAFDPSYGDLGGLVLAHEHGLQLLDLRSGALERVAPVADGLPLANLTSAAVVPGGAHVDAGGGSVWLGTSNGIARRFRSPSRGDGSTAATWRYYAGRRWMPGQLVTAVVSMGHGHVLVLTDAGAAVLHAEAWTLQKKAQYYHAQISPRHDRYGYVMDCGLRAAGDLTSFYHEDSDNDGLWTGMYTASLAFRYAASGETVAREEAFVRLRALKFLFQVPSATWPPHFPARAVAKVGDKIYSGGGGGSRLTHGPHLPSRLFSLILVLVACALCALQAQTARSLRTAGATRASCPDGFGRPTRAPTSSPGTCSRIPSSTASLSPTLPSRGIYTPWWTVSLVGYSRTISA